MILSQQILGYANDQEAILTELIEEVKTLPEDSFKAIQYNILIHRLQASVADFLEFAANLRREGL